MNMKVYIALSGLLMLTACFPQVPLTNPPVDSGGETSVGHDIVQRYTKLDSNGSVLAIQNQSWNNLTGSEMEGTKWSCVLDNNTGLIWEVKTDDGGLRDQDWTYTWYQTWGNTNNTGISDPGEAGGGVCYSSGTCDTSGYADDVNIVGLCGATDWRVPGYTELDDLINCTYEVDCDVSNAPLLNQDYFPNTSEEYFNGSSISNGVYWTSSQYPTIAVNGKTDAQVISFAGGFVGHSAKTYGRPVRLVRTQ